jgi:hypothetical protein
VILENVSVELARTGALRPFAFIVLAGFRDARNPKGEITMPKAIKIRM